MKKPGDKQIEKPKASYYLIEVEALVPTTLRYRILAETPEEALEKSKNHPLLEIPKQKIPLMRRLTAKVYEFGTHMIKLSKNY